MLIDHKYKDYIYKLTYIILRIESVVLEFVTLYKNVYAHSPFGHPCP